MTQSEIMAKLLEISENSYYRWKKKDHIRLVNLIERYFTDSEIEEFLQTGEIINFEATNYIKNNFMKINKNKYIQNFKSIDSSLRSIHQEHIKDFYFYFLTNLRNKKNFFSSTDYEYESNFIEKYDFQKAISYYIFKNQEKEFEKGNFDKRLLYVKEKLEKEHTDFIEFTDEYFSNEDNAKSKTDNFNFDEEKEKQNLIKEIIEHSQKQFEDIYNQLSFIQYWDNDMYFFINYLIKTDFELFINSGDDELLYHAVGFLVYSNNGLHISKVVNFDDSYSEIVNDMYDFFIHSKDKINKNIIKDIISNPEKLNELKKYKIIEKYFKKIKQEVTEEEIHKIIIDSIEFEKIDKELKEIVTKEKNDEIMNNLLNLQNEGIKI